MDVRTPEELGVPADVEVTFVVEDASLVCIACRLEYRLEDEIWDYIGACAPIEIHSSLEGDALVIDEATLERAARYF